MDEFIETDPDPDATGYRLIARLGNSDLDDGEEETNGDAAVAPAGSGLIPNRRPRGRSALEVAYDIGQLIERPQEDFEEEPAQTARERGLEEIIGPKKYWGRHFSAGATRDTAPLLDITPIVVIVVIALIVWAIVELYQAGALLPLYP